MKLVNDVCATLRVKLVCVKCIKWWQCDKQHSNTWVCFIKKKKTSKWIKSKCDLKKNCNSMRFSMGKAFGGGRRWTGGNQVADFSPILRSGGRKCVAESDEWHGWLWPPAPLTGGHQLLASSQSNYCEHYSPADCIVVIAWAVQLPLAFKCCFVSLSLCVLNCRRRCLFSVQ